MLSARVPKLSAKAAGSHGNVFLPGTAVPDDIANACLPPSAMRTVVPVVAYRDLGPVMDYVLDLDLGQQLSNLGNDSAQVG